MRIQSAHLRGFIYLVLIGIGLWQGFRIFQNKGHTDIQSDFSTYHTVKVEGNVLRPGEYRVPDGTSQFEILQVAGVRPTSDITRFNLLNQVADGENLDVGTLDQPVGLKNNGFARLEFYVGTITVLAQDGFSKPVREGISIEPGDRVQTDAQSQGEFSIGQYSRIDLDAFSDIVFEKIGAEENDKTITEIFQNEGSAWYKIVLSTKNVGFKVTLASAQLSVGGNGSDFLVEVTTEGVRVHNMDGLLLVERPDGGEAVNLIAGQTVNIFEDGRPFQVSQIAGDINTTQKFEQLNKEKSKFMMKNMPLNFLFCGTPNVYYLMSVQFETSTVYAIFIDPATSVEEFAQGFSTLNQAYLYGGPIFISTIVEQLFNTRISHYTVFSRESVMRTVSAIGGISMADAGGQKMKGDELVKHLRSQGQGNFQGKQIDLLKALFNGFRTKNIVMNAVMANQVVANIETNFTAQEMLQNYDKFMEQSGWKFTNKVLPAVSQKKGNQNIMIPDKEMARKMLYQG